jgi:hypothetical protein
MAASFQASAMLLPRASCTSIWRNLAMICSELNLFFGTLNSLVPGEFSQSTWSNSTQSGHLDFINGAVAKIESWTTGPDRRCIMLNEGLEICRTV